MTSSTGGDDLRTPRGWAKGGGFGFQESPYEAAQLGRVPCEEVSSNFQVFSYQRGASHLNILPRPFPVQIKSSVGDNRDRFNETRVKHLERIWPHGSGAALLR